MTITHATSRLTIYTSCPFRGLVESNHPTDGVAYEISIIFIVPEFKCTSSLLTDTRPRLYSRSRSAATVHTPHCWLHGFLALPLTSLRFYMMGASTNHPVRIYWFGPPLPHFYRHQPDAFVPRVVSPLCAIIELFTQKVAATSHLLGKDALLNHYHNTRWQVRQ